MRRAQHSGGGQPGAGRARSRMVPNLRGEVEGRKKRSGQFQEMPEGTII